jgi:hypothetical protein
MVFAPAIGIAALQVLGGLCVFVAGLLVLLAAKQIMAPGPDVNLTTVGLSALLFAGGAVACFWGAKMVRRVARGE